MPKQKFRQTILARRRALAATDVKAASLLIQKAFVASPEFARADILALYAPIHNEVDTSAVFAAALGASKVILYPVVSGEHLVFRRIEKVEQLQRGSHGILEPGASCEVYDAAGADLVVIPGVVFDLNGNRIGYGKGYYDRAVHSMEGQGRLVAFCYDFQLVDDIAGEPHDVKMDLLITEKRAIRPRD